MPPRRAERDAYLGWAIPAFRLCHSGVAAETQIHTHMCYSDFTEITEAINAAGAKMGWPVKDDVNTPDTGDGVGYMPRTIWKVV